MNMIKSLLLALTLALSFSGGAFAANKVNINTASAAEIADSLNGIGQAKAEAIVQYREEHGPFKSAEQLAEVRGVGLKTIEKNRDLIELGAARPAAPAAAN